MDIQNTPTRFIRAIRQIMHEKDTTQVVFEPVCYPNPENIPNMLHYDGNFAPVSTVTLPESIPADQREEDWTEERIARGLVLCCEDNGLIHTELITGEDSSAGAQWDYLLCCLYDELIAPEDPDWAEWLEEFEAALTAGVPAEARALRARLLRLGHSKDNPCDTGISHTIRCKVFTPQWQETNDYEFLSVYPDGDTVVITDLSDGHEVEVRNDFDEKTLSGETFDCREMLSIHTEDEDLVRERLRRRVSALLCDSDEQNPVAVYPSQELPENLLAEHPELAGSFVNGAFQVPGDGTIWLTFYCAEEPVDFDEIPISLLESLAAELSHRLDWVTEVRRLLRDNRHLSTDAAPNERAIEEGTIIGEDEACGLSSLEMPHAAGAWLDSEGHITVREEHSAEPTRENALSSSDLRSIQAGILLADRRRKAVDGIRTIAKENNGHLACQFPVPDYIFSLGTPGTANITEVTLDEGREPLLLREGYDSRSVNHAGRYTVELLENLLRHLITIGK